MSALLTSVSRGNGRRKNVSYIKYPSAWAPVVSNAAVGYPVHSPQLGAQRVAHRDANFTGSSGSPQRATVKVQGGEGSASYAMWKTRQRRTVAGLGGNMPVVDIPAPEHHEFRVEEAPCPPPTLAWSSTRNRSRPRSPVKARPLPGHHAAAETSGDESAGEPPWLFRRDRSAKTGYGRLGPVIGSCAILTAPLRPASALSRVDYSFEGDRGASCARRQASRP